MNREKYVNNKSYRDGYEEGRKEGMDAVINTYDAYLNKLEEDISHLREQLRNIKAERELKEISYTPKEVRNILIKEGQENGRKYGFKLGDTIKFSPVEVEEILKSESEVKE